MWLLRGRSNCGQCTLPMLCMGKRDDGVEEMVTRCRTIYHPSNLDSWEQVNKKCMLSSGCMDGGIFAEERGLLMNSESHHTRRASL